MDSRFIVKATAIGLTAGFVGMFLASGIAHVYEDHKALHAIIDMINANAAKQNGPPPQVPR